MPLTVSGIIVPFIGTFVFLIVYNTFASVTSSTLMLTRMCLFYHSSNQPPCCCSLPPVPQQCHQRRFSESEFHCPSL